MDASPAIQVFDFSNLLPNLEQFSRILQGDYSVFGSPEGLSATVIVFLWTVAAGFFLYNVLWNSMRSFRSVRFIRTLLKGVTEDTLAEKRRDIAAQARKNRHLGQLWAEFDETLVESHGHLQNTFDAAHFFNTHTLARGITESRLLAAVPGFLTAIGVIGTFAGLQLGLSGLNLEATNAQQGIGQLVSGASVAFMTSVWGVGMSVVFNFVEKAFEQRVRGAVSRLQHQIDSLFPRLSPEQTLLYIHDENRKSATTLDGLAEQIGHRMQQAMSEATGQMLEGIVSGMKEVMTPAIDRLAESSDSLANRQAKGGEQALAALVEKFSEGMRRQGEEQAQSMKDAREELRGMITQWGESMSKWAETNEFQRTEMKKEIGELAERLSGSSNEVAQKMQSRILTMQDQSDKFSGRLDEFADKLTNTVETHIKSTEAVISNSERLNSQVESAGKELTRSTQEISSGAEHLRSAASGLRDLANGLATAAREISGGLNGLTEKVEQLTGQNIETEGRLNQLSETFSKLGGDLSSMSASVVDASQSAKDQTEILVKHQQELQERMSNHVGLLQEQIAKLLDDYSDRVRGQTIERLDEWNKQTTEFSTKMVDAVNAIAEAVDEIESKFAA